MNAKDLINGQQGFSMDYCSFVASASPSRFQHETTVVDRSKGSGAGRGGATMWAISLGQQKAALAWDWFELSDGVFSLADPVAITSTLDLYDRCGQRLSFREYVVTVNELVYGIKWQDRVTVEVDAIDNRALRDRSLPRNQRMFAALGQQLSGGSGSSLRNQGG